MKRRIALLTMSNVPNYGSALQTFASQIIIEKLGFDCSIINYVYPNKWHYNQGYPKISILRKVKRFILNIIGRKSYYEILRENISEFNQKYLKLTKKFASLRKLENFNWGDFYGIILGSDQVWNPKHMKGDRAFLLSFAPDQVLKISMASSFACSVLPECYVKSYKNYLSRFDAISVRDKNGIEIIRSLRIGIEGNLILDPTLLLSKDQWLESLDIEKKDGEKYIFVYILQYAFNPAPFIYEVAAHLQKKYNYKIVLLGDVCANQLSMLDNYEVKQNVPVTQFLSLIYNASIVVTSSFHGTAFSVNFSKPFVAVVPSNGDDRQTSLLNELGIIHCASKVDDCLETINPFYDEKMVAKKLSGVRSRNLEWLSKELNCPN